MSQLNLQPAVYPENTTGILSTCWMLRLHTSNAGGQTAAGDESRAANAEDAVPEDAVPAAAVPAAAVPAAAVPAAMNARARPVDGTAPAASPVLATIARATAASTADRPALTCRLLIDALPHSQNSRAEQYRITP